MVTVVSNIKAENFAKAGVKARISFTQELLRLTEPLTPRRKGILIKSARVENEGRAIVYKTPYARRLWYGDTFNFRGAPIRGSRWVDRAYANNKQSLLSKLDKFIKRGL